MLNHSADQKIVELQIALERLSHRNQELEADAASNLTSPLGCLGLECPAQMNLKTCVQQLERLAELLDETVYIQQKVEELQEERKRVGGATHTVQVAAAAGDEVAEKLRDQGHVELAEMVEQVVAGHVEVAELENTIAEARAAAADLRAELQHDESRQMEVMAEDLEKALFAHQQADAAEQNRQLEAAAAAGSAIKVAGEAGAALDAQGFTVEAKQVRAWHELITVDHAAASLKNVARSAREMAAKLEGSKQAAEEAPRLIPAREEVAAQTEVPVGDKVGNSIILGEEPAAQQVAEPSDFVAVPDTVLASELAEPEPEPELEVQAEVATEVVTEVATEVGGTEDNLEKRVQRDRDLIQDLVQRDTATLTGSEQYALEQV